MTVKSKAAKAKEVSKKVSDKAPGTKPETFTESRDHQTAIHLLEIVKTRQYQKEQLLSPDMYGFPDLLSEELTTKKETESETELVARQEMVLYEFVKDNLYLLEDGRPNPVRPERKNESSQKYEDHLLGNAATGAIDER